MNTPIVNIAWFALLLFVFYFILIRPQQKAMKEHQELVSALKKDDKIITRGGIYGAIRAVEDDSLVVQIADNVNIKMNKDSVERLQG